jgi:Cu-Zn family superoxide dismutase
MISRTIVLAALFGAVLSAANKPVTVTLKDGDGKEVGTARVSDLGKDMGVKIALNVKGLEPGEHALHIHQAAKCEGPKFTTAGGHFNPDMKKHGLENPEGPHAGDMKNFMVKPDGTAKVTVEDSHVSLGEGDHSVFAGGGTALMIHAKADDLKTDPAGNAGDRIACGTITK